MRRIYCHPRAALIYYIFSTLSHKRHDFQKEKIMDVCLWGGGGEVLAKLIIQLKIKVISILR
jgi:hypothetical protein